MASVKILIYNVRTQIVHQLIEKKQSEIRKVHPGLSSFDETGHHIDIKDIPGIRT